MYADCRCSRARVTGPAVTTRAVALGCEISQLARRYVDEIEDARALGYSGV